MSVKAKKQHLNQFMVVCYDLMSTSDFFFFAQAIHWEWKKGYDGNH